MSLLALITRLGHALISGGLGGPGDSPVTELPAIACPALSLSAARHTTESLHAASHVRVSLAAAAHTKVNATADC